MGERLYRDSKGQSGTYGYAAVIRDGDGWVSADDYTPIAFDILDLMLERKCEKGFNKIIPGWYTGVMNFYDGRLIKKGDKVIKWRRSKFDKHCEQK